jgi:transposase
MNKKKAQRIQYSETFKARAIKLASASTQSVSQTARELGIAEKTLYGWLAGEQSKAQAKTVAGAINEQSEVERLRVEVRRLKDQCEILRRAAIYFAGEG